jgi:hypothetical protein
MRKNVDPRAPPLVIDGRIITQWDPCPGVLKLGEYTLWVIRALPSPRTWPLA